MLLHKLLENIYCGSFPDVFKEIDITSICSDSREVQKGSLFIALKGYHVDGISFIEDAIEKGARVIVTEAQTDYKSKSSDICFLKTEDPQGFLAKILMRFYQTPWEKIKIIGVTGTNGKTTITYLLESILTCVRKSCGVIGTVNHRFGNKVIPADNTTPGLVDNYQYISDMVGQKIEYCVMEVSSHALTQRRVEGIDFNVAVFTNLTQDHLDYHKNLNDYFLAKSLLFKNLSPDAIALINHDDSYAEELFSLSQGKIKTYGIKKDSSIMAKDIILSLAGSTFNLITEGEQISIRTNLIGRHNIYNILAAVGVCFYEGISLQKIKEGIEHLVGVPGRLERIQCGQDFNVFIDYAHTEDALKNILSSIREVCSGRIVLVFGCGGDRDQDKRPKMGKIACDMADDVIVTSDNPRTEDPKAIIDGIVRGITKKNYTVVLNRIEAIHLALDIAQAGNTVLIVGKGHEDYQILKDKKIDFNERQIIEEYLRLR